MNNCALIALCLCLRVSGAPCSVCIMSSDNMLPALTCRARCSAWTLIIPKLRATETCRVYNASGVLLVGNVTYIFVLFLLCLRLLVERAGVVDG
jgi:hypothetical protein